MITKWYCNRVPLWWSLVSQQ